MHLVGSPQGKFANQWSRHAPHGQPSRLAAQKRRELARSRPNSSGAPGGPYPAELALGPRVTRGGCRQVGRRCPNRDARCRRQGMVSAAFRLAAAVAVAFATEALVRLASPLVCCAVPLPRVTAAAVVAAAGARRVRTPLLKALPWPPRPSTRAARHPESWRKVASAHAPWQQAWQAAGCPTAVAKPGRQTVCGLRSESASRPRGAHRPGRAT